MSEAMPTFFTDDKGERWTPVLTTPAIIKACRECGLTLESLMTLKVNLGDMIAVLWYACEREAKARAVGYDSFWERIPPARLGDALKVLWNQVTEAFPELKDVEGITGKQAGPFAPSKSETS